MKADMDDAPARRKKSGTPVGIWAVALMIATGITGGGLYLASNATSPQSKAADSRNGRPVEVVNSVQPKKEIKDDAYWDRIVAEQAKRDAYEQLKERTDGQGQTLKGHEQQKAEQERRANEAIKIVDATRFGEGVPVESTQRTGSQKKKEIVVVGKREARISDFCPGGEGSITRRNCRATIELQSRN